MSAPSDVPYSRAAQELLARHDAIQAEAERIMAASRAAAVRTGFPKPAVAAPERDARLTTGEFVPASCVELDDAVGDDSVVLIARDPFTGKPLLKIWMAKADASPEWGLWLRRWLARKCRRSLRLMR